jgi:hypothetical protein
MRIHLLGSDPTLAPPSDPMFPPGNLLYSRQIACRIFQTLYDFDSFLNCVLHGKYSARSAFFFPEGVFSVHGGGSSTDPRGVRYRSAGQLRRSAVIQGRCDPTRPFHQVSPQLHLRHEADICRTAYVFDLLRGRTSVHWRRVKELIKEPNGIEYKKLLQIDHDLSVDHKHLVDIKTRYQLSKREEVMWLSANR